MTSKFSVIVKKFSIPFLFLALGLFMLIIGIKDHQGTMYMVAAMMMLLAGLLSVLYSTGKLKSGLIFGVGGLTGIAALATLFFSFRSCKDTQIHDENYVFCKSLAIQNLQDIRDVQKIFMEQKGRYAATWEELEDFIRNGKVEWVDQQGNVPQRKVTLDERDYLVKFGLYEKGQAIDFNMTEKDAYFLSKWENAPEDLKGFKRDTNYVSLMKMKFIDNKAYVQSREVNEFPVFNPDSLKYIPFTNAKDKWTLEVRDSVPFGDAKIPTIKVSGVIPFSEIKGKNDDKEEMHFGNLNTNSTSGSWEE